MMRAGQDGRGAHARLGALPATGHTWHSVHSVMVCVCVGGGTHRGEKGGKGVSSVFQHSLYRRPGCPLPACFLSAAPSPPPFSHTHNTMSDAGSEPELDLSNVRGRWRGPMAAARVGGGRAPLSHTPLPSPPPPLVLSLTLSPNTRRPPRLPTVRGADVWRGRWQPKKKGAAFSLTPPHPPLLRAAALKAVIDECKPGAKIADICVKGDAVVDE